MDVLCPLEFRHLDQVVKLAALCFPRPWGEKDFAYFLAHECGVALGVFQPKATGVGALQAYFIGLLVQGDLDVVSVATNPLARRRGIAARLMGKALQSAGVHRAFLEVDTSNAPAIALYQKLGFEIQRTRRGYYDGKRDAFVMEWISPDHHPEPDGF